MRKKFYIKREKTHTIKHRIDKTSTFHSPKLSKNVVPLFTTVNQMLSENSVSQKKKGGDKRETQNCVVYAIIHCYQNRTGPAGLAGINRNRTCLRSGSVLRPDMQ
jgi:hypothetical protein